MRGVQELRDERLLLMVEVSLCVALAIVLSYFKFFSMPQGGSVSLQMVPLLVLALRRGGRVGLLGGLLHGTLRLLLNATVYYPVQALLDYPLAFFLIGVAGFFYRRELQAQQKKLLAGLGVFLAFLLRFFCHVVSGKVFFGVYAPEGMNQWLYSFNYNVAQFAPEAIAVAIVFFLLLTRRDLLEPTIIRGKLA